MIRFYFNEKELNHHFLPLTHTRGYNSLLCGALTIQERWMLLAKKHGIELKFVENQEEADITLSSTSIPEHDFEMGSILKDPAISIQQVINIERPWHLIQYQAHVLKSDISLISKQSIYASTHPSIHVSGKHSLFVHPSAKIETCFIQTEDGPVLIEEGAHVMQGSMLRGPLYIGKNAVVKMGATLYAGTSIGHHCIVGGEIKNSIFYPYSNKAHHGYIGDSIIGAWCNLGAGTTCSNLKNTVGKIKVWDIHTNSFKLSTEKMGIILGDHVRTAVNTSFNSGTVVGAFANVFELKGL
ncbi:MAG: hypothetical protein RL131_670, partial [Bacteroidota bacterium]